VQLAEINPVPSAAGWNKSVALVHKHPSNVEMEVSDNNMYIFKHQIWLAIHITFKF